MHQIRKAKQGTNVPRGRVEGRCALAQPSLTFINVTEVHPDYSKYVHFYSFVKQRINELFNNPPTSPALCIHGTWNHSPAHDAIKLTPPKMYVIKY